MVGNLSRMAITEKINKWLEKVLYYPGDDAETMDLKKTYFIFICIVVPPVISLTALTIYLDMPVLEAYGWMLLIMYAVSVLLFLVIKRYVEVFYYWLSTALLLVTFFTVARLGGILYSAGILYSSLASAVFAFVFKNRRFAIYTSLLYMSGILAIAFLQPKLVPAPEMVRPHLNLIFTAINGLWISMYILGVIFYVFDKRARDEKAKAEKIREVDELKTRLFTNITHEFRTPLTLILGAAATQEKGVPASMPVEGKGGRMELIRNNAHKLLRLVNQMLNLSRLESGTIKTNYVQTDMISYLAYLVDSCHSMADKKGVKLHFLKGQDHMDMDTDPDKLEDIILNLIYNAIKFTQSGGDVYLTTTPPSDMAPDTFRIHIRDTGIGISEANIGLIFDRFFQVEDQNIPVQEGSGIGLTLVREYVKLLGGKIEVTSKLNEGTEFVITLPVTRNAEKTATPLNLNTTGNYEEEGIKTNQSEHTDNHNKQERHTILIVEDNQELAHYLNSLLAPAFHTLTASNGQEGMEKAMENIPDLILSDVMMPVKDGYDLCNTLKSDFKTNHIPIILLTARADTESRIQGLNKGADDYISKPFQPKELLIRIRKLIEQREKLRLKYSMESTEKLMKGQPVVSLDDRFISELYRHLEMNYKEEDFGIDDLCHSMSVSRVQLHRKLVGITGLSASHFISRYRVEKAAELLRTTRMTVSEAAFEVGFHDSNYFSRIFSKVYGVAPGDYRKQKQ